MVGAHCLYIVYGLQSEPSICAVQSEPFSVQSDPLALLTSLSHLPSIQLITSTKPISTFRYMIVLYAVSIAPAQCWEISC
jgi:hypothetical protein